MALLNSNKHILGCLVFEAANSVQAVSGLHDFNSGDISLRIFMLKGRTEPFLRLAARFRTEALNSDNKYCEHEVCFDINLSDIGDFETVSISGVGKDIPDALVDDELFINRYKLGLLERLQVSYNQICVNGLDLACKEASSAQKDVLMQLAQLSLTNSFTFYVRRKKAFRQMVKNMNDSLSQ